MKKFNKDTTLQIFEKLEERGREMPHDLQIEKQVLGWILLSRSCCDIAFEIFGLVEGEDIPFYDSRNRFVFEVCRRLFAAKKYPELVLAAGEIKRVSQDIFTEGITSQYLTELTDRLITNVDFKTHCLELRELHSKRKAIIAFEKLTAECFIDEQRTEEIFDTAELELMRIREGIRKQEPVDAFDISERMERDIENGKEEIGIKTPFSGMNEIVNHGAGFLGGDYIIIGARPSVGKTSLAVNLTKCALDENTPGIFFSLEMKNQKVVEKLIEIYSGVPYWRIREGFRRDSHRADEWEKFQIAKDRLKKTRVFFDDSSALTPLEIRARISRWKQKFGVGFAVIDYLQLIRPSEKQFSRDGEIRHISMALKATAKDLDIPIIVCCQLNRESIKRVNQKPSIADLRDGGSLEQDADIIILPYDPIQTDTGNNNSERSLGLIVAKNRLGACKTIGIKFQSDISTMTEDLNFNEKNLESITNGQLSKPGIQ